jgi:hypothetical protein
MEESGWKCPICGGSELLRGIWERRWMGGWERNWFIPSWYARKMIIWKDPPYRMQRFVCLKCGYAGDFLPEEELARLKAQMEKRCRREQGK